MRPAIGLVAGLVAAAPGLAATVNVTVPRLAIAEYNRPYVVGWIEPAAGGAARTFFVWYDGKKGGNEPGSKWLAELRSWWRKGGRSLAVPADGISGATRVPGSYAVPLPANLPAGQYVLNVEAAREKGGREVVSIPFAAPLRADVRAAGRAELGAVALSPR